MDDVKDREKRKGDRNGAEEKWEITKTRPRRGKVEVIMRDSLRMKEVKEVRVQFTKSNYKLLTASFCVLDVVLLGKAF